MIFKKADIVDNFTANKLFRRPLTPARLSFPVKQL